MHNVPGAHLLYLLNEHDRSFDPDRLLSLVSKAKADQPATRGAVLQALEEVVPGTIERLSHKYPWSGTRSIQVWKVPGLAGVEAAAVARRLPRGFSDGLRLGSSRSFDLESKPNDDSSITFKKVTITSEQMTAVLAVPKQEIRRSTQLHYWQLVDVVLSMGENPVLTALAEQETARKAALQLAEWLGLRCGTLRPGTLAVAGDDVVVVQLAESTLKTWAESKGWPKTRISGTHHASDCAKAALRGTGGARGAAPLPPLEIDVTCPKCGHVFHEELTSKQDEQPADERGYFVSVRHPDDGYVETTEVVFYPRRAAHATMQTTASRTMVDYLRSLLVGQ